MSHLAGVTVSAWEAEKCAKSPSSAPGPAPRPKLRSCVTCRTRKVRCDKQSPCSHCRRANIACILASTDRSPRWARRLERYTNNAAASNAPGSHEVDPDVGKVMDRLQNLEKLVKELSGQPEQAHAPASLTGGGSSGVNLPASSTQDPDAEPQRDVSSATDTSSIQKQFGRLVLQNAGDSRYVSSGFWSWVNDELDVLRMDARGLAEDESSSSEDEAVPEKPQSTQQVERTYSDHQAFLFGHSLDPMDRNPDLREFHPLPSQIPFLLDVFSENVNFVIQIVHVPTVTKMIRNLRGRDMMPLAPSNEALMFSIYYAAITSMEEADVITNFGLSKTDLTRKYRLGLERALAKADFLDTANLTLVQAFALFLCVVRQHDSPRFVWMMTGLVIRMAQYLGLQRDGAHFRKLSPFDIEMRRRVWWAVCMLDLRASEDQGTDLTIVSGSFDTKIALNINDGDISVESTQVPTERIGVTDMTFPRINAELCDIMRQMMAPGFRNGAAGLEDQNRMLNEIYQRYQQGYFQYTTEAGNIAYWVGATIARLVMAKMTLIVSLPILFTSTSEDFSDELRTKLLVSAIEVAEYNHALHAEQACRHWRWIFQTYTHWHAIVYLMIEVSQRPWSPIIERAWLALHSSWLVPAQSLMDKKSRIWIPLRKLMAKARKHRDVEVNRLRVDPQAVARLEADDRKFSLPSSSGPFPKESSDEDFRERWRQLVAMPTVSGDGPQTSEVSGLALADLPRPTTYPSQPTARSTCADKSGTPSPCMTYSPTRADTRGRETGQTQEGTNFGDFGQALSTNTPNELALGESDGSSANPFPALPADWSTGHIMEPSSGLPWLWTDVDPSIDALPSVDMDFINVDMDLDGEVNWYDWVESAKNVEMDANARPGGSGQM